MIFTTGASCDDSVRNNRRQRFFRKLERAQKPANRRRKRDNFHASNPSRACCTIFFFIFLSCRAHKSKRDADTTHSAKTLSTTASRPPANSRNYYYVVMRFRKENKMLRHYTIGSGSFRGGLFCIHTHARASS